MLVIKLILEMLGNKSEAKKESISATLGERLMRDSEKLGHDPMIDAYLVMLCSCVVPECGLQVVVEL